MMVLLMIAKGRCIWWHSKMRITKKILSCSLLEFILRLTILPFIFCTILSKPTKA